jgi:phenylalanyl-tRNA synthetase beta chain
VLISLNWIRTFCPFETRESPLEVGARFSLHTAEVEAVIERGGALAQARAAAVLGVRPHPGADRLRLVSVDAGAGRPVEVVCGAPGVREGMVVPYAAPGAVILGREIREAEVRGVRSPGMLLSEKELEVSDDGSGLWSLPPGAAPGTLLSEVFPALVDVVLEVDNKSLTHRPDLWGHHGVAREFSALYGVPLEALAVDESLARAPGQAAVRVSLEGKGVSGRSGLCRRYCGLQIDGVRVGPSPEWLRHRLLAVGARPINGIVDVTNYILFELGQPLHAFDATRVAGGAIRVRRAAAGERMKLLDGHVVELRAEDLVIADANAPVALAGVMGGAESEISAATTSVFLESANFAPGGVRRTSVRVGRRTDSSLRFEKSLDPENARTGILRAAAMILELCPGARVVGALQDVGYEQESPIEIRTSEEFLERRLGSELPSGRARSILESLGFSVEDEGGAAWRVRVPSWRGTKDISIAEDLVEEVGRIHGFDNLRPFAPEWQVEAVPVNEHRRFERRAKEFLAVHGGLCEVFTYSLVGGEHCRRFGLDPAAHLALRNPLNEDMDRLRREIVPVLLEKTRDNQRYAQRFGLFELGRVYRKDPARLREPELPDERRRLAGVLSFEARSPEGFYEARRLVMSLLEHLRVGRVEIAPFAAGPAPAWVHPSVAARVLAGGKERGVIARVHPAIEERLELAGDVVTFDLDFDALFEDPRRPVDYRPPMRYPTVLFDVAVVAPERTPVAEIQAVLRRAVGDLLVRDEVFDVFQSEAVGAGKRSVAVRLEYGSRERTLGSEEVAGIEARVVRAVGDAGWRLR